MKNGITRVKFINSSKPRAALGDRRTTKKYGDQVRAQKRTRDGHFLVSNRRPVFEWVSVDAAKS